jgi:hypothetical protein
MPDVFGCTGISSVLELTDGSDVLITTLTYGGFGQWFSDIVLTYSGQWRMSQSPGGAQIQDQFAGWSEENTPTCSSYLLCQWSHSGSTYRVYDPQFAPSGGSTYDESGSGGIYGNGSAIISLNNTRSTSGGAKCAGKPVLSDGGGGGPSTANCTARGSGTAAGKLAQTQISSTVDDGFWTYSYYFNNGQVLFGSQTPIV